MSFILPLRLRWLSFIIDQLRGRLQQVLESTTRSFRAAPQLCGSWLSWFCSDDGEQALAVFVLCVAMARLAPPNVISSQLCSFILEESPCAGPL